METGQITPCNCGHLIGNFYDFSKKINFKAIGKNCSLPHCYNGHGWLSMGNIPELDIDRYAVLRNRVCIDGTEWINEEMKEAMNSKLCELNKEYSLIKKISCIKIKNKELLSFLLLLVLLLLFFF